MGGQFDSPGYCAYYCVITALESVTRKVIGFKIVTKKQVNNNSANAERFGFGLLLNDFLTKNLRIGFVTSDNSKALNSLFENEYPEIKHYLDLWHVLRKNMHRNLKRRYLFIAIISL